MWRHGTRYGYSDKGCRCDECVAAERVAKASWRAKRTPAYADELRKNRERKATYTGICKQCGGVTRYNGHPGKQASDLCVACHTAPRTHCKNGHLLIPENRVKFGGGGEMCRLCRNAYMREWTRRERRKRGVPEYGEYRRPKEEALLETLEIQEAP